MKKMITRTRYVKTLLCLMIIATLGVISIQLSTSFADDTLPFYDASQPVINEDNLSVAQNLTTNELTQDDTTFGKITSFFGLSTYTSGSQSAPAIVYLKMIVNMLLGLVSFIALIMIIMAFYMIFFSKQEEGVAKAKKMLVGVAIALVVMGLSRYIVSYFYDLYAIATTAI